MKTVFTRSQRVELNSLISELQLIENNDVRDLENLHAFLDRYTEEAIPEHILACARYLMTREWTLCETEECEKFQARMAAAFGHELWSRAITEVRNENPDA